MVRTKFLPVQQQCRRSNVGTTGMMLVHRSPTAKVGDIFRRYVLPPRDNIAACE